jgi:hypothetical protein
MKMSQVVQVNDAEGKNLTKVLVGDTKTKALERLGSGRGRLENKDGVGLLDDEVITAEGGPYVFKETQQQHQQDGKLRCCFCILVFKCCFEYKNDTKLLYSCNGSK